MKTMDMKHNNNIRSHEAASQDKSLELKLGPPGENQPLCYTSTKSYNNNSRCISSSRPKRDFLDTIIEEENRDRNWFTRSGESHSGPQKKAYPTPANFPVNIEHPNSSEKRLDQRAVVGWPPIRACRKNLSISKSTKTEHEISEKVGNEEAGGKSEVLENTLFVKIKMDGVPIGRKVDLKCYSNYDKLSSAVDELFRGLLAAQGDRCYQSSNEHIEKAKAITGLLEGNGDYTLVYEDNEGDRMLVGDVPWHMFISSAKRLRVLKKSELSATDILCNKPAE